MNAPNGSEGTRDALPPASPVPERQVTDGVERKSGRPAISWTGLFALFSCCSGIMTQRALPCNSIPKSLLIRVDKHRLTFSASTYGVSQLMGLLNMAAVNLALGNLAIQ